MSVSKITAALASASNEFTLAAASLNFDFSLVKLEAPKEFSAIGPALSDTRRENAEGGPYHMTARRLGALFEALLPSTPHLIRSYGSRASEISASPIANPKGSTADGFFAAQVGLDGTGLWAAATSGTAAISVHLLACMLARIWTAPEATSIWVQIVAERKKEIEKSLEEEYEIDYRTLSAARQEISRQQLAEWDASARAWLQAADEVNKLRQQQLLLIVNNVHVAVNHRTDVYASVVQAWRTATKTLDALVQGMPQQVQNGAVLLGLSAWHLYPDMVVLGSRTQPIKMNDSLVAAGGCITVGLQSDSPEKHEGVYWSLPLANFRYYGDPVRLTRSAGSDASRITFDQLWIVTLGGLLHSWKEFDDDHVAGARFIATLWNTINQAVHGKDLGQLPFPLPIGTCPWLRPLANAASFFLESDGLEKQTAVMLFGLGKRMGSKLLFFEGRLSIPPAFKLNTIESWLSVLNSEGTIRFFRMLCSKLGFGPDSAIIRYLREIPEEIMIGRERKNGDYGRHRAGTDQVKSKTTKNVFIYDYASVAPLSSVGSQGLQSQHCRWLATESGEYLDEHDEIQIAKLKPGRFESRSKEVRGEENRRIDDVSCPSSVDRHSIIWNQSMDGNHSLFIRVLGNDKSTALFLKEAHPFPPTSTPGQPFRDQLLSYQSLIPILKSPEDIGPKFMDVFDPRKHCVNIEDSVVSQTEFFSHSSVRAFNSPVYSTKDRQDAKLHLHSERMLGTMDYSPLHLLNSVGEIYKLLPNATVSCNALTAPLMSRSWVKKPASRLGKLAEEERGNLNFHLDRNESFAALAFFETGRVDLEISEEVMALSYGNSIYVAASLLCDPQEKPFEYEMKRITGNVGRAGISLLVPPKIPRIKAAEPDKWAFVRHDPFTVEPENNFEGTSVHLSFTGFEAPLDGGSFGNCDTEVYYMETVVSVHDTGMWVADLDILRSLQSSFLRNIEVPEPGEIDKGCTHKLGTELGSKLTSVDNWHEFLDKPENGGVARAHKNWLARLALTSVSVQRGDHTLVLPEDVCWSCVMERFINEPGISFMMIW